MDTTVIPYLGQYTFCMVLNLFFFDIEKLFLHSIQIGATEKCFSFLNLESDRNFMYFMGIIDMIWSYVNFYNVTFLFKELSFDFRKACLKVH